MIESVAEEPGEALQEAIGSELYQQAKKSYPNGAEGPFLRICSTLAHLNCSMVDSDHMISKMAAILLLCLLATSCQKIPADPDSGHDEGVATQALADIRALLDAQVVDWNNGDIDSFMSGYVRSDSLRFASANAIIYGWQATLDRYNRTYSSRELMGHLEFDLIDIDILAPTRALVFGRYHLSRSEDVGDSSGLFTLVLNRTSDGWKIAADHTSSG